jgi:serpin B
MPFSINRRVLGRGLVAACLAETALVRSAAAAGAAATAATPLGRVQAGFAVDLVAAVAGDTGRNAVLSPYGVAAVLAELDLGADKPMHEAIAKTLRLARKDAEVAELRAAMRIVGLQSDRPGAPFSSANAIFVDRRVELKPGIEDKAHAEGGAPVVRVDFAAPAAIEAINQWGAQKTGGRIAKILAPGVTAELVAVNAIAFKDAWRTPFDVEATGKSPFQRPDGSSVDVDMMYRPTGALPTATKGRFVAVELAYADPRCALVLVTTTDAPAKAAAFAEAAELLAGGGLAAASVHLALPRFAATQGHDLLDTLAALGLAGGLTAGGQLSGFADGLKLGAVRQEVMVKVDEKGTEAAAVTAALATRSAGPAGLAVRFDKPFVFALRHRQTGAVLAAGYIGDPTT